MRPSRGEGREQVITKVRGGRKTNNFHVGLDFFSGVFCCVASQHEKVLEKLATSDKVTIVIERQPEAKCALRQGLR
jgi:hypothetical protein